MLLSVLIGIAALALLWLLGRLFISTAPATLARAVRWLVAFLVAVAIAVFVYAGREALAAALVPAFLAALLRWRPFAARRPNEDGGRGDGGARMTRAEALQIFDLKEGASEDEIREAHRRLIVRIHPDRGGSTFLAAKLNEAREVLLGRG
jgi:DnaJ-domain-containing protein 1